MKNYLLIALLIFCFNSFGQFDLIDFESTIGTVEIDETNLTNIWQIGQPNKTFFDSSYSASNAILTDTISSYPVNDSSSFTIGIDLFGSQPTLTFKHKFDTDTLKDGGYIEVSFNNGATWTPINNQVQGEYVDSAPYGMFVNNLYDISDTLANGRSGLSGRSDGWVTTEIYFECWAVKTDFMVLFRFNFYSDENDSNHEGWMIDEIAYFSGGGCGSIGENELSNLEIEIFPNPFLTTTELRIKEGIQIRDGVLKLFDHSGRQVLRKENLFGANFLIDRGHLNSGVYYFILSDENHIRASGKLVVN